MRKKKEKIGNEHKIQNKQQGKNAFPLFLLYLLFIYEFFCLTVPTLIDQNQFHVNNCNFFLLYVVVPIYSNVLQMYYINFCVY